MEKNNVTVKKLDADNEETKKLLKEYQLPEGNYYDVECGDNWIRAIDMDNYLIYHSEKQKGKNNREFIDVRIDGSASKKGDHMKKLRYDITDGTENAKLIVEEMKIYNGQEVIIIRRHSAGSENFDGELEDSDSSTIHYVIHQKEIVDTLLTMRFNDRYQNSEIYQSMHVGIPSDYVRPADSFVLPGHTVYRIGKKDPMLNIALEVNSTYVLKDDTLKIRGMAFEEIDKDLYEQSLGVRFVEDIFGKIDLSQAKSVILYGNLEQAIRVLKKDTGIEIVYKVIGSDSNNSFEDSFSLPCKTPYEINRDEIDSIIANLQNKYSDEIFIDAVVIELEKFKTEMRNKVAAYPQMMSSLGAMNIRTFNFDYILENRDYMFVKAREEYNNMYANSLTEKQYH